MPFPRGLPVLLLAAAVVACGGGSPPEPAAPVATEAPAPEPQPSASPAPPPTQTAAASAAPEAPPAPQRTPPTLEGQLLGKPFKAVAACAIKGAQPGTVALEIYDVKDFDVSKQCMSLPLVEGARKIGLLLPWKEGEKVDVASLKITKDYAEGYVMEVGANKKLSRKDFNKDFKPKGTVEILRAPKQNGGVGRLRVSMTSGKDKLNGEVDVEIKGDFVGE
jgi:hypothetical protein